MKKIYLVLFFATLLFGMGICKAEAASIEEGVYMISTALDEEKYMNVNNNIAVNGTKINIFHKNDTWGQLWNIEKTDDGYYIITSYLDENISLDLSSANAKNGGNLTTWSKHGGDNQQWLIKETDDGYYNVISKYKNLSLDIYSGLTADKTNVILWESHGGQNQKFKFEKVNKTKKTLEDGTYTISTALDLNKKLTVNNNTAKDGSGVNLFRNNDTWGQVWNVKYVDNGYYVITSYLDDNVSLDLSSANTKNGGNLTMWSKHGGDNQQWLIKESGDGYYNVISKYKKLSLDISNLSDKANVILWEGHGGNNQKFKFDKVEMQKLEDGIYTIHSKLDSNKVISMNSELSYNTANVQLDTFENDRSQKWHVTYIKNGYYKVVSALDNKKSIDIHGGKTLNGSNAEIYDYHGGANQQWIIKYAGDGYYNITSMYDSVRLDVEAGKNIILWSGHDGDNQKFMFNKTTLNELAPKLTDGYYTIQSGNNYLSIDGQIAYNGADLILKNDADGIDLNKWHIKSVSNNLYEIRYALNPNKVFNLNQNKTVLGTKVQLNPSNKSVYQKWYIVGLEDGNYKIISANGYNPLTISDGSAKIYPNDRSKEQKFKIVSTTEPTSYAKNIEDGYYTISSALNSKMVFDVYCGNIAAGTNVQLYSVHNGVGQIWKFKYIDGGMYEIISALNPKRALSNVNGNIQINKYTGGDDQRWYVKMLENNQVSLISAKDSLFIDLADGRSSNETNIKAGVSSNADSQKFILNTYGGTKTYRGIDVSAHQKIINWNQLSKSNIHFALIRLGFGTFSDQIDKNFEINYKGATDNDIPVGIYYYSYALNTSHAKTEAQLALKWLNGKHIDFPIFYDLEDADNWKKNNGGIPDYTTMTNIAETFCSEIIKNGYQCGIYASKNWLINMMDAKKLSEKYPIWVAHYTGPDDYNTVANNLPKWKTDYNLTSYKYWQFSSLGRFDGAPTVVDLDFGYDIFD